MPANDVTLRFNVKGASILYIPEIQEMRLNLTIDEAERLRTILFRLINIRKGMMARERKPN